MPELPEVETIRRGLSKKITGLQIKNIQILNPKTFHGDPGILLDKKIKIQSVWRRAKVLGIDLTEDIVIIFHLKMSGQLIFHNKKEKFIGGHPTLDMASEMPNKSTRVIFEFSDDSKLFFNDQRKFGWIKVISKLDLDLVNNGFLKKLGPEPLEKDFSWQILKTNLLKHKSLPVKVALLDQSAVAGIGNIYASEACFISRINPKKIVSKLTDDDFKKLHKAIIESLQNGIKFGGASRSHFVDSDGKKGYFLDYAYVYGKTGQKCRICQAPIESVRLAGRSTFYCPNCQVV